MLLGFTATMLPCNIAVLIQCVCAAGFGASEATIFSKRGSLFSSWVIPMDANEIRALILLDAQV